MNKEKAREVLFSISTPEERAQMTALEISDFNKSLVKVHGSLDYLSARIANGAKAGEVATAMKQLAKGIRGVQDNFNSYVEANTKATKNMQDEILKGLSSLGQTLTKQAAGSDFNKNAGPLYKTMINHLAGMEGSFRNWKYPQYAAVSVRNKNFSNIDPATNDQAGTIGTGTVAVTTGGTAVQLSATSVPVYAVYIQAHESNTNPITVGDKNVVGALSGRRGITLYNTNFQRFRVSDLNMLWIDSITNGDKINYYYEAA